MLHCAFEQHFGYHGSCEDLIEGYLEVIGPQGNLLMPSMPYRTSALDYLSNLKSFDVRKTPSAMGLVSEFFRRRPNVLRSANPTHPILACGPKAEWFVEGHENCEFGCGPGSVFDKLLQVGGKVAFFNLPFAYFTFFHYLEHRVRPMLRFNLYREPAFDVNVVNRLGRCIVVKSHAFSIDAMRRRRFAVLERWLLDRRAIKKVRLGASYFLLVELTQVVGIVDEMARHGDFFYDMSAAN